MVLIAAALVASLAQDPQLALPRPQVESKPPVVERQPANLQRDVIQLVGGEEITGRILSQRGNYIEVQLDAGTTVGFERSRVANIARAKNPLPAAAKPRLSPRDDWFLLHDAAGRSAGYMHGLVQILENGSVQVSEEWCFTTPDGQTQITVLEEANAELEPQKSFYHERVLTRRERLASERLVSAEVAGPNLVVQRRTLQGREKQEYPFSDTSRFPLLYRERLRQAQGVQVLSGNQELFDARSGQFRIWKAKTVARRKVEFRGETTQVRELTLNDGVQTNSEWIDAQQRVVRREVNGPALIAVRVSEARARRASVRVEETGFESAIVATTTGSMGLWLPNPVWRSSLREDSTIVVTAPLYRGSVTLMALDQVRPNVRLDEAADLMTRWLKLTVGHGIRVQTRDGFQVQRAPAIRLKLNWSVDRPGESTAHKGVCYLFRVDSKCMALFCSAPRETFGRLELDFGRILDSVQLDAADIEPVRQGPLAGKPGRR